LFTFASPSIDNVEIFVKAETSPQAHPFFYCFKLPEPDQAAAPLLLRLRLS
jgi:hypothetical protein